MYTKNNTIEYFDNKKANRLESINTIFLIMILVKIMYV